jgi:hypothetical protein
MVPLETLIEELNNGNIEFQYNTDKACSTVGECVIYLKELEDYIKSSKEVWVVFCRCPGRFGSSLIKIYSTREDAELFAKRLDSSDDEHSYHATCFDVY